MSMSMAPHSDCFVVVNGPEDGTEFPVVRAPLAVGSDPSCAIHLRLDSTVLTTHAQLAAVTGGYRVRRVGAGPVLVDGKAVGAHRSLIVRHGGLVQIGDTLLQLVCAPDGLASRSRTAVAEGDVGWAMRQGFTGTSKGLWGFVTAVGWLIGRCLRRPLVIVIVVVVLLLCWPQCRHTVVSFVRSLVDRLSGAS